MRLTPVTYHEAGIAHHEAGHALVSVVLAFPFTPERVRIWQHDRDEWAGRQSYYHGATDPVFLPEPWATPPHVWRKAVETAWADLLIGYAGPAAARRYEGLSLDAEGIRSDDGGEGDEAEARKAATHFWSAAQRETVLDRAAELAGLLVQVPRCWEAIQAVAGYLLQHARHQVGIGEIETLVRRFLPVSIPAPEAEWAAGLAKDCGS